MLDTSIIEEPYGTKFFDGIPCFVPNTTFHGKEDDSFYVSFNHVDQHIYGCDTTALVLGQTQHFYILNGDHIEEYKKLIPLGFDACLEYFKQHQDLRNRYSERII